MKDVWIIRKLGEVCTSDLGKTLNQAKDTGKLMPYLCSINVQWDRIDLSTVKQARFERADCERFSVKQGDLLVCEGGDIGRAAIWDSKTPMLYQNALHRVRFKESILPRYCLRFLQHLKLTGILDQTYGKGVTIKHLVKSSLFSIPIPIPPIAEQEKIVAELDCLTGIIEKKKQQLEELDKLAQSIFYEMFGDPISNEKGWTVKLVREIASVKIGPFGSLLHASDYITGGYPVINPVHMREGRIFAESDFTVSEEKRNEMSSYFLERNDIILGRRGDIGRCALVSATEAGYICGTGSLFVRFTAPIIPIFSLSVFMSNEMKVLLVGQAKGATMLNINCGIVEQLPVILPPLGLQTEFAQRVEAIEKQKELVKRSIEETETLFNSRMDYWFNN